MEKKKKKIHGWKIDQWRGLDWGERPISTKEYWRDLGVEIVELQYMLLPRWYSGKESACQCKKCKREVRSLGQEDPLEKEWQPTPVFLPGKFYGQKSLVGYSPWGRKRVGHN